MDRRRAGPPTDQPPIERRHRSHVTRALEQDGFAIVAPSDTRPAEHDRLKLPRVPAASPIERLALKDVDERALERILGFKRRWRVRRTRRLILAGLIGGTLVLLMLSPAVKTLMSRTRPVSPPSADRTNASTIVEQAPRVAETPKSKPAPPVAETPSPNTEVRASQRTGRRESQDAGRPREASTLPRGVFGPGAVAPPTAVPAPSAAAPTPSGLASKTPSPQVALPQVDVTRNPAPASEGGGEAYSVRLSDTAGRPLAGAEVSLVIRMADGTLVDVSLGAGPDLGTYHVTIPPLQPGPVDLRLRVVTNNKRVEIPLTP